MPHLPWKNVLYVRSGESFHAQSPPSSSTSRDLDQNWVAICLLSSLNHHLVILLALGQRTNYTFPFFRKFIFRIIIFLMLLFF